MTDDNTTRKGGRRRTGTIVNIGSKRSPIYQAIVTLNNGKRKRLPPLPQGMSEAKARDFAAHWSERAKEAPVPEEKPGPEKLEDRRAAEGWVNLWIERRKAKVYSWRDNGSHWEHHISKFLGDTDPRKWTPGQLRELVNYLDARVVEGKLTWKSAVNIWATATKMCSDLVSSKFDDIRVRDGQQSIALNVEGPDRGEDRAPTFLYPSELEKLMAHPDVPERWKRTIAITTYLWLRAGELRVLKWEDVNLTHREVHIHQAWDKNTRTTKPTKGMSDRRPPIHPNLVPLLEKMRSEAAQAGKLDGFVVDMPSERDMARGLRLWLGKAGVDRAGLFSKDTTRKRLSFHDLRATGITWAAVAGLEPLKIQQRAGHDQFSTTQKYIRTAEALDREAFGEPFPTLPGMEPKSPKRSEQSFRASDLADYLRSGRDSKERQGDESAQNTPNRDGETPPPPPSGDAKSPLIESRSLPLNDSDPVEVALATALERASAAGEWATVAQLARELEARRKSHDDPKVVPLRKPKSS